MAGARGLEPGTNGFGVGIYTLCKHKSTQYGLLNPIWTMKFNINTM